MADTRVQWATLVVAVVAVAAIAYLLGSSGAGKLPDSASETSGDGLARLEQIEVRLGRIEKRVVSLESAKPGDAVPTRTELTRDGVTREAALESAVSEL